MQSASTSVSVTLKDSRTDFLVNLTIAIRYVLWHIRSFNQTMTLSCLICFSVSYVCLWGLGVMLIIINQGLQNLSVLSVLLI